QAFTDAGALVCTNGALHDKALMWLSGGPPPVRSDCPAARPGAAPCSPRVRRRAGAVAAALPAAAGRAASPGPASSPAAGAGGGSAGGAPPRPAGVIPLAPPQRGAPARPVARSGHPRPDQGPRRRSGPRSSPEPGSGRVFGPVLALTTHVPYATLMPGGPQWHPGPLRSPGALRHHPPVRSRVRRPHPDTPGKRPTPLLRSLISGLVLAFAGSRANISRTILSCAGIVVGVGALIAVVTAGHFGQTYAKVYGEAN